MKDRENESGYAWLVVVGAGLLFYNVLAKDDEPGPEQVDYLASELSVPSDEAADLLTDYSSPEDAIDDYLDSSEISNGLGSSLPGTASKFSGPTFIEDEELEPFDEYAAKDEAEREMAAQSYDYSYGCTIDCSGHEAGWQWRAQNDYPTYGSLDYGKSQSFAEGARAYEEAVDRRVEEMRDDYDAGIDPGY